MEIEIDRYIYIYIYTEIEIDIEIEIEIEAGLAAPAAESPGRPERLDNNKLSIVIQLTHS